MGFEELKDKDGGASDLGCRGVEMQG
jgi:hypothetical protein